jgi:hypothetical protein
MKNCAGQSTEKKGQNVVGEELIWCCKRVLTRRPCSNGTSSTFIKMGTYSLFAVLLVLAQKEKIVKKKRKIVRDSKQKKKAKMVWEWRSSGAANVF